MLFKEKKSFCISIITLKIMVDKFRTSILFYPNGLPVDIFSLYQIDDRRLDVRQEASTKVRSPPFRSSQVPALLKSVQLEVLLSFSGPHFPV